MRPAMAVAPLLLLLLLVATAQGIRLEGESSGAFQKKVQEENGSTVGSPDRGTALCSVDGQYCSGRGSRKLLTEAKAAPKSTRSEGVEADHSQKLRTEEEAGGVPVKPAASEHKKTGTETYPDLMDIAGMDYSPAVRKPPIHN